MPRVKERNITMILFGLFYLALALVGIGIFTVFAWFLESTRVGKNIIDWIMYVLDLDDSSSYSNKK